MKLKWVTCPDCGRKLLQTDGQHIFIYETKLPGYDKGRYKNRGHRSGAPRFTV